MLFYNPVISSLFRQIAALPLHDGDALTKARIGNVQFSLDRVQNNLPLHPA